MSRLAAIFLALACAACTSTPRFQATSSGIATTIVIRVSAAVVNNAMDTLRQLAAENRAKYPSVRTQINSYPEYDTQRSTVVTGSDRYAAALDDAHRKADGIARKLGVSLGPVQSVEEILYGAAPRYSPLKGNAPALPYPSVNVAANQPVILYVVYNLASSTGANGVPHLIAVYGMTSLGSEARQSQVQLITVNLNASGKTLDEANAAEQAYEGLIRERMRPMLEPGSAITTTNVSSYGG
jgi:hypothetical protein